MLNYVFMNTLYFGDNLEILKRHISNDSVDLIYLDPPFNSNRDYNVLFREQSGNEAAAQILTIEDLLEGRNFDFPLYGYNASYQQAERMQEATRQGELEI